MASFFKGIGSVVNKAQVGMAAIDLEAQRKAKENTVRQQIQLLKSKRENVYARIGREYFAAYRDDPDVKEQFKEMFEILIKNENEMTAQEKQLDDIRINFEEEVRLLRGDGKVETARCPKCGAEYTPGVTLFCAECGGDLRGKSDTALVPCPGCGNPYDPASAKFCKKCGHKLTEE